MRADEGAIALPLRRAARARGGDATGDLEARALRGERAAWDALIQLHEHRVVMALVADNVRLEIARELTQETWILLVAKQRRGVLRELALPGLAIAQARFLARDQRRLASERQPHVPLDSVDESCFATDAPERRLASRQALARARRVLANENATVQRIFVLVYGGKPRNHGEIAAELGLSLQRVRQILCELRKTLRAALEESP